MARALTLIEERLSEQSIAALQNLIGQPLSLRMPSISTSRTGSMECERLVFITRATRDEAQCVFLDVEEFEAPLTQDCYYRLSLQEQPEPLTKLWSDFRSTWSYDTAPEHTVIKAIEVYSYESLPDQVEIWGDEEDFPETLSFDFELLLVMSDTERVSVKPQEVSSLIAITLKPSFELPKSGMTLGKNITLRMTIN